MYIPIIKTTNAELRGYETLSEEIKSSVIPLFELTKSRKTKIVPHGDVNRSIEKLSTIVGKNRFILDLTSHPDLMNYQIETLLNEDDGFDEWYKFLNEYSELNIIPVVHAYEDGDLHQVTASAEKLESLFDFLAFRGEANDEYTSNYIDSITQGMTNSNNLYVIIDAGYVDNLNLYAVLNNVSNRIREIRENHPDLPITICSSSFPRSVTDTPNGGDDYGVIDMCEVSLYVNISSSFPDDRNLYYGDYASIHPFRYDARGGAWVPRVDFPLDDAYIYHRYRRNKGGYVRAAKAMINDDDFDQIDCWGFEQILDAADDSPSGLSPSFWIAVRMNIHVTRKTLEHGD